MAPLDSVFPSPLEMFLMLRNITLETQDELEDELETEDSLEDEMAIFEEWSDIAIEDIENWSGDVEEEEVEESQINQETMEQMSTYTDSEEETPTSSEYCLNICRRLLANFLWKSELLA